MSKNIKFVLRGKGMILLMALGGALGIFLLLLGSARSDRADETVKEVSTISSQDPEAYARTLERRIEELCADVTGVGRVRVTVTLKGGYRAVYATDAKSSSSGAQSSTVLVGSGASEEAILISYENPEISGVGIVCEGGASDAVRMRVISLVSATLNIGTNKIYVAAGQVS